MLEILALSLFMFPMSFFGLQALAEKLCKQRYPNKSPEDRAEMIKIPSRAFSHAITLLPLGFALVSRVWLGKPSLATEFVYLGAVASTHVFYSWEDEEDWKKIPWERLFAVLGVYVVGVYAFTDSLLLRFSLAYSFFGVCWVLFEYACVMAIQQDVKIPVRRMGKALRAFEIVALQIVAGVPLYQSGMRDPYVVATCVFLNAFIYMGGRRAWWK